MPFPKFLTLTTLGTLIWNTGLTILGSIMGENWTKVVYVIENYSSIVLIVLIILFIVGIYIFYKKRRKNKEDKNV